MGKKFFFGVLAYFLISAVHGMTWHFNFMKDVYDGLRIYNRTEPVIPLGLTSMLIQGAILAYFYPFYVTSDRPIIRGAGHWRKGKVLYDKKK